MKIRAPSLLATVIVLVLDACLVFREAPQEVLAFTFAAGTQANQNL